MNIPHLAFICAFFVAVAIAQNCPATPCAGQLCCSIHGYCGSTSDYCSTGHCADNCWSGCKLGGDNSCPAGQCCSQYGYCGTTPDYCSPANNCFSGCSTSPTSPPASGYVFAGYMASWMTERPSPCTLVLSSFDSTKFTHLNVAFAGFDTTNFAISAMNGDDTSGWYSSVTGLKSHNSNLKVLISIGGGGFGTGPFSTMASSAGNRQKFVTNAISFARSHSFDGIDIDWEFPDPSQTSQIQLLFQSLHSAIAADASTSGKPALLLTVTSPNYQSAIDGFGFANIQPYLDWINVMNYDYYGPGWSTGLGSNTGFNSVENTFSFFSGVPSSKLVMGFANYARGFTLSSPSQNTPGSPFSGPGSPGPCSQDPDGTLTYTEVSMVMNASPHPTIARDSAAQTPYLYHGKQWVTYDDVASLQVKLDYLTSHNLRGAMVWTVDANHTLTDYIASKLST
eukprot:Phypoly_transcript_08891.p1 GENE.Phypoly_transcript_08891~~Phypoly_transcript_08891.p1  ORF type:complete len:466 (+),score=30.10 Phypoly_transcript_08891:43-1398(+)